MSVQMEETFKLAKPSDLGFVITTAYDAPAHLVYHAWTRLQRQRSSGGIEHGDLRGAEWQDEDVPEGA